MHLCVVLKKIVLIKIFSSFRFSVARYEAFVIKLTQDFMNWNKKPAQLNAKDVRTLCGAASSPKTVKKRELKKRAKIICCSYEAERSSASNDN